MHLKDFIRRVTDNEKAIDIIYRVFVREWWFFPNMEVVPVNQKIIEIDGVSHKLQRYGVKLHGGEFVDEIACEIWAVKAEVGFHVKIFVYDTDSVW